MKIIKGIDAEIENTHTNVSPEPSIEIKDYLEQHICPICNEPIADHWLTKNIHKRKKTKKFLACIAENAIVVSKTGGNTMGFLAKMFCYKG